MARVSRITDQEDKTEAWRFVCPGCGIGHAPFTKNVPGHPCWGFNGDVDRPTFTPSLLVRWDTAAEGRPTKICHSFVTDGKIQFLDDCTHHLKGQTVELPDVEDD